MSGWHPTHRVTYVPENQRPLIFEVMEYEGGLYSRAEWQAQDRIQWPDWMLDDDGLVWFQGRRAPGDGTVSLEQISSRRPAEVPRARAGANNREKGPGGPRSEIGAPQARELVARQIEAKDVELPEGDELIILDAATIEKPWGWVFFYTSRLWHETRDIRYAIAGNAPYIVYRHDGSIHPTRASCRLERCIFAHEKALLGDRVPKNGRSLAT